jgi:hypothetical protein
MSRCQCGFGGIDPAVLAQFQGTERYHQYSPIFRNVLLTDGAKYVADNGGSNGAYWLMDAIARQIPRAARKHPMCVDFQVWELRVYPDQSAVLMCVPDADMEPVLYQRILYTDFDPKAIKFYVVPQVIDDKRHWVIMLPSEY